MYMLLSYQPMYNNYISIWSQSSSHILEYSSSFPSVFAPNITCPSHTSSKPSLPTQFSRPFCVVCSTLQLCFKINPYFFFPCCVTY